MNIILDPGLREAQVWGPCTGGQARSAWGPGSPEAIVGVQGPLLPLAPLAWVVEPVRGNHHEDQVRVVVILLLLEAPQVSAAMVILIVHPCRREGR